MSNTASPSDRFFDFSLRLLTIFVLVALVACAAFLVYRWLAPQFESRELSGLPSHSAPTSIQPAPALAGPSIGEEVLMDPHRIFRCEDRGRVSFSDQACVGSAGGTPAAPARSR